MRHRSIVAACASAACAVLVAPNARADVTSWLAVGGGYGLEHNAVVKEGNGAGAFSATLGVGSSPRSSVVIGGVFRSMTYFGLGTDVTLSARVASGGFARGDWGLALDAGAGIRPWREGDFGRYPIQAILTLGAPWGLEAGIGADVWNIDGAPFARSFFGVVEIDLLRFTLMRQGSTEATWRNPAPAGGHLTEPPPSGKVDDDAPRAVDAP